MWLWGEVVVGVGPLTSHILVRPTPTRAGAMKNVVVPSATGRGPLRNAMITTKGKAGGRRVVVGRNSVMLCNGCTNARLSFRNGGCLVVHRDSIMTMLTWCLSHACVVVLYGCWGRGS